MFTFQERNSFFLMCFSAFASFAIAMYFYFFTKKNQSLYPYISLQALLIGWSTGFVLVLLAAGDEIWLRKLGCWLIMSCICFSCIVWVYYCVSFTNLTTNKKRKLVPFVSLLPLIFWFYYSAGIFQSARFLYPFDRWMQFNHDYMNLFTIMFLYAILGQAILFRSILRIKNVKRIDFILILSSSLVLVICFLCRILYRLPLEIIPLVMTVSSTTALFIASFRNKLFRIVPISIFTFTESIDQAMCLVDKNSNIIGFNRAFRLIFGDESNILEHEPIEKLSQYLQSKIVFDSENQNILDAIRTSSSKTLKGQIRMNLDKESVFAIIAQSICNSYGKVLGCLILFNDITEAKMLNRKLKDKNDTLFGLNEELSGIASQLTHHALNIEELSVQRERSRILSDLHDSVGQVFTSNFSLLQCAKTSLVKDHMDEVEGNLMDICRITEEGLSEIEHSLHMEKAVNKVEVNLPDMMEKLASKYSNTAMKIKYSIEGEFKYFDFSIQQTIYRILQESITNSARHGNANLVTIVITIYSDHIKINVEDNGKGCSNIKKGLGLKGMEARIRQLNGMFTYGSFSDKKGFWVQAEIPDNQ